jgi:hypothetical protein
MTYNSSFQDRAGQAAEAKKKALEQYRSRPPLDEKAAAERKAAGQEREAAKAQKAAAKKAERTAAAEAQAADAAAKAADAAPPTEAERKASRDARYAARKARRSRIPLGERVRDRREDVGEVQPQRLKRDDAGDGDQAGDEAVLDGGRGGLIVKNLE